MQKVRLEMKLKKIWQVANALEENKKKTEAEKLRKRYYELYRKGKEVTYANH